MSIENENIGGCLREMAAAASIRGYDYASVYKGGKEFQLEYIRACLPQYRNDSKKSTLEDTDVSICCYQKSQVYPVMGGELQLEQVRAMLPQYQKVCEMEMTEVVPTINELQSGATSIKSSAQSVDDQLELLCAEKLHVASCGFGCSGSIIMDQPSESNLVQDKENLYCQGGEWSPDDSTIDCHGCRMGGNGINTKLNFTDTESFVSVPSASIRFNVTSELEVKAMQVQSDAVAISQPTTVRRPLQPLSGQNPPIYDYSVNPSFSDVQDESSFIPYQDNSAHGSMSEFRSSGTRKPLQSLQKGGDCSSHASFSVYNTTCDQSSFSVFQDSMSYSAPLGVPLTHHDHSFSDQTFTQMDIGHPRNFEPVSTPKNISQRKDISSELVMDLSAIPSCDNYKGTAPLTRPLLTPIKEESSGSSKFSSSSSSSSSSSTSCHSVSGSTADHHNPFLPDMVNRMLNSLGGVPPGAVQSMPSILPSITPGQHLTCNHHTFHIVQHLGQGSFSSLYLARDGDGEQVFRVYTNTPLEWEVTILSHLESRLDQKKLQEMKDSFHKYDQVYHYQDSYVTLSRYYSLGSLQNIIEKYVVVKKMRVPECLVTYFAVEMFSLVGQLHDCGIIHAALKPAHFLVRDISGVGDPRGMGLCLTDWRHAIDTRQFTEEQMFVGVPPLSAGTFLVEGQPWKWQIDYNGLAMCLLPLITNRASSDICGAVKKCPQTGIFSLSTKPYKAYNTEVWQDIISKLLNADCLVLGELGRHLKTSSDFNYIVHLLQTTRV